MKKSDLYRLLDNQDTSILIQLLEENNDYFKKCIEEIKKDIECEINIKYIIYLTIFSKMIINILKNRLKLNDIK